MSARLVIRELQERAKQAEDVRAECERERDTIRAALKQERELADRLAARVEALAYCDRSCENGQCEHGDPANGAALKAWRAKHGDCGPARDEARGAGECACPDYQGERPGDRTWMHLLTCPRRADKREGGE